MNKSIILRAYQLVPKAYKQKFTKYKICSIKHLLYSYERKKIFFICGLCLRNLIKTFYSLRQAIPIEELKHCVPQGLKHI